MFGPKPKRVEAGQVHHLTILLACTKCGTIYEPEGYNLHFTYGKPAICPTCLGITSN